MNDDSLNPYAAPQADLGVINLDQDENRQDASNGKRFLNYIIDRIAWMGLITFFFFLAGLMEELGWITGVVDFAQNISRVTDFVISTGFFVIYYTVCESLLGRTLGKLITGTKVIDLHGKRPSFLTILARSLSRLVPFEPLSFFGSSGGWHDRWSETRVVDMRKPAVARPRPMSQMRMPPVYRPPRPPSA